MTKATAQKGAAPATPLFPPGASPEDAQRIVVDNITDRVRHGILTHMSQVLRRRSWFQRDVRVLHRELVADLFELNDRIVWPAGDSWRGDVAERAIVLVARALAFRHVLLARKVGPLNAEERKKMVDDLVIELRSVFPLDRLVAWAKGDVRRLMWHVNRDMQQVTHDLAGGHILSNPKPGEGLLDAAAHLVLLHDMLLSSRKVAASKAPQIHDRCVRPTPAGRRTTPGPDASP